MYKWSLEFAMFEFFYLACLSSSSSSSNSNPKLFVDDTSLFSTVNDEALSKLSFKRRFEQN